MQFEPFALQLHRQFTAGWGVHEIAAQTGIPVERVRQRLDAAEAFLRSHTAAEIKPLVLGAQRPAN